MSQTEICSCDNPQLCCSYCIKCLRCGKIHYQAALEVAYQMGTRHEGEYDWGDGGFLKDMAME
jgi:hypothetical protein